MITKLMMLFLFLFPQSMTVATASDGLEVIYTNVYEDLQKDPNFNYADYPIKSGDYSLDIIAVAESTNKELFVYVYNPSSLLELESINISQGINDNLKYINYDVTLLNSYNALSKYKVEDLVVLEDVVRYYSISSVQRMTNSSVDSNYGNQTINTVAINISKRFTAVTNNDVVTYTVIEDKTITITEKYVGFIRYLDSWLFVTKETDSHFVAFNTDLPMDYLYEAELSYITQEQVVYSSTFKPMEIVKGDPVKVNNHVVTYEEVGENHPILAQKYSWQRIQKVSEIIDDVSTTLQENIKDMEWILRFVETPYSTVISSVGLSSTSSVFSTIVSEVTILRLKFKYDGVTYNLGAIDNKQTGSQEPDDTVGSPGWNIDGILDAFDSLGASIESIGTWLKVILGIILVVLILSLLKLFVNATSALGKFITWIFNFVGSIPRYVTNLFILIIKILVLPINACIFIFIPKSKRQYIGTMPFRKRKDV